MSRPSDQQIITQFNAQKQDLQALAQKIGELEQESEEHNLVIETISPMNSDRKCFRMVGGVLIERTVEEVLPALQHNNGQLKAILEQLVLQYKKKDDEFQEFQRKYDIKKSQ